ncbi:hypothetical protein D3C79_971680 [compost metagenome]
MFIFLFSASISFWYWRATACLLGERTLPSRSLVSVVVALCSLLSPAISRFICCFFVSISARSASIWRCFWPLARFSSISRVCLVALSTSSGEGV